MYVCVRPVLDMCTLPVCLSKDHVLSREMALKVYDSLLYYAIRCSTSIKFLMPSSLDFTVVGCIKML